MKKILSFLAFLAFPIGVVAQVSDSVSEGQPAFAFCSLNHGLASLSDPAWASFGNGAILPFMEGKVALGASYYSLSPDGLQTAGFAGSGALRIGKSSAVYAGALYQKGDSYTEYDALGRSIGEYIPSDLAANVGYAVSFADRFSAAVSLHYMSSAIADGFSMSAFSGDISGFGRFGELSVAAGLRNVGPGVKDSGGNVFALPTSLFAAGDYSLKVGQKMALEASADAVYYLCGGVAGGFGLSAEFFSLASLRAGYHFASAGAPVPSYASAGLGVHLFGVSLNLAYLFASEALSGSLLAGVVVGF